MVTGKLLKSEPWNSSPHPALFQEKRGKMKVATASGVSGPGVPGSARQTVALFIPRSPPLRAFGPLPRPLESGPWFEGSSLGVAELRTVVR